MSFTSHKNKIKQTILNDARPGGAQNKSPEITYAIFGGYGENPGYIAWPANVYSEPEGLESNAVKVQRKVPFVARPSEEFIKAIPAS